MEALGINLGLLIVQIIAFIIVFLTLNAWVYQPMLNMMESRKQKIAQGLEDARVAAEARASAEKEAAKVIADAQTAPQASGRKVALVGFSLGGGGVLLHGAPLMDLVSAVVAYYPAITSMGPDMMPLASRIRVPVLLLSGEQDRYFNCCLIESMRALASAAKANHAVFELVAYPGANHGFNLNVPTHRADDANDAWGKTISFLRRLHPPFVQ